MRQVADELGPPAATCASTAGPRTSPSGDTHLFAVLTRIYDFAVAVARDRQRVVRPASARATWAGFFRALRMPATGFAALSPAERLIEAGPQFLLGASANPVLRDAVEGRAAPTVVLVTAFNDVRTGGGYEGPRRWATQGFAVAGRRSGSNRGDDRRVGRSRPRRSP